MIPPPAPYSLIVLSKPRASGDDPGAGDGRVDVTQ